MLICDTHALVWDALDSRKLSRAARRAIEHADAGGALACCDISLWEMVVLIERGRLALKVTAKEFLVTLIARRALRVLPVTVDIALRSQQLAALQGDPADRLIAATALEHGAPLVTADERLAAFAGLRILW
jgi:PIN domain nuclease of toxin-antitoxin system